MIILNHDENHKEEDLKLSRYFKQVLSTTKITNGLKDNLKSLELFETINEIYLEKEAKMQFRNCIATKEMSWIQFSKNENEQIKNTDPFTYKIGEKYYFNVSYF